MAQSILDGDADLPDSGVLDWLEIALLDPDAMSGADLARGLSGVHACDWFEAAIARPQSRALLVELMHRGVAPEAAWPRSGEMAAELVVFLADGARTQHAVARSAPEEWIRSWARQASSQVVVESPRLVDRLLGLDLNPHDFRLHTGGTQWSEWNDEAWLQWLEFGSALRPGLRAGISSEGFAGSFAHLVVRLPRDMLDQAIAQLMRWPTDLLGSLVEALVRCRNAPPELLIQTLDRLPPEEVRHVVQRHWPELGLHLGLPRSVVQALKPNRGWFGLGSSNIFRMPSCRTLRLSLNGERKPPSMSECPRLARKHRRAGSVASLLLDGVAGGKGGVGGAGSARGRLLAATVRSGVGAGSPPTGSGRSAPGLRAVRMTQPHHWAAAQ